MSSSSVTVPERASGTAPGTAPKTTLRKLSLLLVSMLTIMAGATISAALPGIEAYFAGTPNAAMLTRLVLTLPALCIALAAPFAGALVDRLGRQRLLVAAIVLFGGAGMSGLVAGSLAALLVGRAFLGLAVACIMTCVTTLAGDYFEGAERSSFLGLQAAFMGGAGLFFLTGGGYLAEIGWRAPFLIYGVAFLLLPSTLLYLRDTDRGSGLDVDGSGAVPAVDPFPVVPVVALYLAAAFTSLVFYIMPTQLPFLLHAMGAGAPSQAGTALGLMTLGSAVTSLSYGWLKARLAAAAIFAFGFGGIATGLVLVWAAGSYAGIAGAAVVTGASLGLMMPNLMTTGLAMAPARLRGRVTGGLTFSIFIGQFLSPLASQPLIGAVGYPAAFGIAGLAAFGAALVAFVAGSWRARRPPAGGIS